MEDIQKILKFWLEDTPPKKQFSRDDAFDHKIQEMFGELHKQAAAGELDSWQDTPGGSLALIILLDQFSRNMYRGSAQAFAQDERALKVAKKSIEKKFDMQVEKGRSFFYMPFMHSENIEDQETCVKLFEKLAIDTNKEPEQETKFAVAHRDIIKEFGRFPNRNEALKRKSTPEEIKFLQEGKGF